MNARTVFTLLVVFLIATLAATTERASPLAFVASASGQGSFLFQQEEYAFSFNATATGSSTSGKGTAQFDNLTAQTSVTVKLNCVKIAGSEAVMSGKVVETTDSDFPKNSNVVFGLIDGALSPIPFFVDRITPLFVRNPGINCNDGLPLPQLIPEEGGVVITP
jgi:biopolymer transport protein ExbD